MSSKNTSSLIIIYLLCGLIAISVAATYWRMMVVKDFIIVDDTEEEGELEEADYFKEE